MEYNNCFWEYISKLVKENEIIIDRPKGTRHPKYKDMIYEVNYGYIKGTKTSDGGGIDVFKGSLNSKNINTIFCTIDLLKKDIEIKILIGCTEIEKEKINRFLNNSEYMKAILIEKKVMIENRSKKITQIGKECDFYEIFEVFEDVIFLPTIENVKNILIEYNKNNEKTLYGYFLNKKLVGIIGIKNNTAAIEILHFGIHPEYRGKKLGTELMDFIKKENKTMFLSTDDDAVIFYRKYGYKCTEYIDEKNKCKRYNCVYKN